MADTKLSALTELSTTPADNDEIYIRDESEAVADESKRITVTNLLAAVIRLSSKVITQTRDMTAVSGDVSYTGIGFEPSTLIIYANIRSDASGSWGIVDSARTERVMIKDAAGNFDQTSAIIYLEEAAGKTQSAVVSSYDADGFTLTWTKAGTPSAGSGDLQMLFLR